MKIATILSVHQGTEIIQDSLDAIRTWVSPKVAVLIDGAYWDTTGGLDLPGAFKLQGMYHNCPKSPYRNVVFGMANAYKLWPKMDWYCYCEYDVLFTSSAFKKDLAAAQDRGAWMLGNDYREGQMKFPLLEAMVKTQFDGSKYLLGCCTFHSGEFVRKMAEQNYYDKFLNLTNAFAEGFFPGYAEQGGYDFAEHFFPTMAHYLGGKVEGFASWKQTFLGGLWHGNFKRYPMRWQPELDPENENFPEASIMHPLKTFNHPIREFHRLKRSRINKGRNERQYKLRSTNFGLRGGFNLRTKYAD